MKNLTQQAFDRLNATCPRCGKKMRIENIQFESNSLGSITKVYASCTSCKYQSYASGESVDGAIEKINDRLSVKL